MKACLLLLVVVGLVLTVPVLADLGPDTAEPFAGMGRSDAGALVSPVEPEPDLHSAPVSGPAAAITLSMVPDPCCPAWFMTYTLSMTNTTECPLTHVVITSPLPAWPVYIAEVDPSSTLDGVLNNPPGVFVFQTDSLAPGQSVVAKTILRSYSQVEGEVENVFYVDADEMLDTVMVTHTAMLDKSRCATSTPTEDPTPTVTPTPDGWPYGQPTIPAPTVPPPTVPPTYPMRLYVPLMTCP